MTKVDVVVKVGLFKFLYATGLIDTTCIIQVSNKYESVSASPLDRDHSIPMWIILHLVLQFVERMFPIRIH